jgi:hypothetical protein
MTAALEVRVSEPIPRRAPVRAACNLTNSRRLDPDHARDPPARPSSESVLRAKAARELCGRCPIRQACADDADAKREFGVRGGALRHEDGELGGRYVALALIPNAAASRYDRRRVAAQFYAEQENTS